MVPLQETFAEIANKIHDAYCIPLGNPGAS